MAKVTTFSKILAFDTALNFCSVAVFANGKASTEMREMAQGHAEHLVPMAERVLKDAKINYKDIEAIVTTVGPGAFTGLRIGLSTARAMALALNIPIFGITTTQILAVQQARREAKPIGVVLETKRQDFYFQAFDAKGNPTTRAAALPKDKIDIKGLTLIGDGLSRFNGENSAVTVPDMALAAELLAKGEQHWFSEGAGPVYLRDADVTESKRQNRTFSGSSVLK
jgi:tRNA threonylcarbamoyladenosine biosynthesis protein TsaB